jgi:hypothetical protein
MSLMARLAMMAMVSVVLVLLVSLALVKLVLGGVVLVPLRVVSLVLLPVGGGLGVLAAGVEGAGLRREPGAAGHASVIGPGPSRPRGSL